MYFCFRRPYFRTRLNYTNKHAQELHVCGMNEDLVGFLECFFFDLFYLFQYFFDDNFADTMTTETRQECDRQNCQIAQQEVVNDGADISEYNASSCSAQVVLEIQYE